MTDIPLDAAELAALRDLLHRRQIEDCIHRYARGLDRHDEDLIRSAYHPDAMEDHGAYIGGVDGLVRFLFKVHKSFAGYQRHVTTSNIDIDGDEAHAESYFLSILRTDGAEQLMLSAGRYVDRLERRDLVWKISTRVVVMEWQGTFEGGAMDPQYFVEPRLDHDDVSYERPLHVTRHG